jgi:hypothetical protein
LFITYFNIEKFQILHRICFTLCFFFCLWFCT